MGGASATPIAENPVEAREKAKLRKALGRFDLELFTACPILAFDTVAASAQARMAFGRLPGSVTAIL